MKVLVTGSAGYLGEALVRTLEQLGHAVTGIDVVASPSTSVVGSITDRALLRQVIGGADAVIHAATLHKPHVATHSRQDFVDTNISGTLCLLEESVAAQVGAFVFTSTTSAFGDALTPPPGSPTAWITEDVVPRPKNIYGVTKTAAEDLCQLFHRNHRLPIIVLRTSRFFPEPDDDESRRDGFVDANLKVNELLYRRVDLEDVVSSHVLALGRAQEIGFDKFIVSATTPFTQGDIGLLRSNPAGVLRQRVPAYEAVFGARGWRMLDSLDRVYVNERARTVLGWQPHYDFARAIDDLAHGRDTRSPLAREIRFKGYHQGAYRDGIYPV